MTKRFEFDDNDLNATDFELDSKATDEDDLEDATTDAATNKGRQKTKKKKVTKTKRKTKTKVKKRKRRTFCFFNGIIIFIDFSNYYWWLCRCIFCI